jgi:hypothetical protein
LLRWGYSTAQGLLSTTVSSRPIAGIGDRQVRRSIGRGRSQTPFDHAEAVVGGEIKAAIGIHDAERGVLAQDGSNNRN